MLRINKAADYGFVLLIQMSSRPMGALHNARDLADATRLPAPMVSKILKALARGGILASHRGTKGGYSLARPSEAISAADVVTALDGPIQVTECLSNLEAPCGYETACPVKVSWRRLNDAIVGALQNISLAEMTTRGGCCPVAGAFGGAVRRSDLAAFAASRAVAQG
jgi:FeS assembly SUF system regulator